MEWKNLVEAIKDGLVISYQDLMLTSRKQRISSRYYARDPQIEAYKRPQRPPNSHGGNLAQSYLPLTVNELSSSYN